MKKFIFIFLTAYLYAVPTISADQGAEYTPIQQSFYDECSSNNKTNWFYDCACAAQNVPEIVLEDQKERFEKNIKNITYFCEQKNNLAGRALAKMPRKNPFDQTDQKDYDDPCELLKITENYSANNLPAPTNDKIWLSFTKKNICKDAEGIRQNALDNCMTQEDQCECFADSITQSWLNYSNGFSSRTSTTFQTQAMSACRGK